jgi:type II secretory pathway pseudopilin PulG
MVIAALIVAIVSALASIAAVRYARRSDQSAARSATASERSAVASEARAALEAQRRHAELTPRFRVTCASANPGVDTLRLSVFLAGPPELGQLDSLTVKIRDDHPWRADGRPLAGGPSPDEVAAQIWGPYRFMPGSGPGADSTRGIPGADPTGRVTPTRGMPVGEALPFFLEPTRPPQWSSQPLDNWRTQVGTLIRLQLDCQQDGLESWTLTCEYDLNTPVGTVVDVP